VKQWVSRGSLAFSVAVSVALVAMVPGARADLVQVATGQGKVDDATADRVLVATDSGGLQIDDVATSSLTDVPLPDGQHMEGAGRLIGGGALFVTSPTDVVAAQLNEWHGGVLTSLGGINSATFLAVAGDYAIWDHWDSLYRLTISSGATDLVSSNAGNTDNDVASNGDVVYWAEGEYAVHRWRSGIDSLISHATPLWAVSPLTDGTNVVYSESPGCCNQSFSQVAFSDGATETVLDHSYRSQGLSNGASNYALNTGWIAYNAAPIGGSASEVWVRSPSGTLSRVSPAGGDSTAGILGVDPTGQVLYRLYSTSSFALGAPGDDPFPLPSLGSVRSAFWENGHWYLVVESSAGWNLLRLDTDTAIVTGPPPLTSDTQAIFTFASSAQSASYECSLDGGAAAPCSSPVSYTGLAGGTHTLSIQSTDTVSGEEDATLATSTWTVDTTPPAAPTITRTDPPSPSGDLSPSVQGAAESGSTVKLYTTADCSGDPVAQGSAADFASPGLTVSVSYDSTASYRAAATDAAGNTSACSAPISYTEVSPPPTIYLTTPFPILTGDTVTFSASASSVFPITDYQWDLDGNGTYETDTGATPTATNSYSEAGDVSVSVRVTNSHGKTGTSEVTLPVRPKPPPGPIGVSINNGDYATNSTSVQLNLVWPAYASEALISNDGGFGSAGGTKTVRLAATRPWTLRSAENSERISQTIYLRFPDSGSPTQTFSDDIILDTTTPLIQNAALTSAGKPRRTSSVIRAHVFEVRLRAKEKVSGISSAQFSTLRHGRGTTLVLTNRKRRGIPTLKRVVGVKLARAPHWVRVRSAAGTWSHWHPIR